MTGSVIMFQVLSWPSVLQIIFSFEPRNDLFDHLATIGVVY
jgi:hypothetical protein